MVLFRDKKIKIKIIFGKVKPTESSLKWESRYKICILYFSYNVCICFYLNILRKLFELHQYFIITWALTSIPMSSFFVFSILSEISILRLYKSWHSFYIYIYLFILTALLLFYHMAIPSLSVLLIWYIIINTLSLLVLIYFSVLLSFFIFTLIYFVDGWLALHFSKMLKICYITLSVTIFEQ